MMKQSIFLLLLLVQNLFAQDFETKGIYKRVSNDSGYSIINYQTGDTLIPAGKYQFLNPLDEQNMILAKNHKGKEGYINVMDEVVVPFIYDDLGVFSNGFAPAKKDGKWSFINRKGEAITPFIYDNIQYFYSSGLAIIGQNNKFGLINSLGEIVVPIQFDAIQTSEMDCIAFVKANEKWAIFDENGLQLSDFIYDRPEQIVTRFENLQSISSFFASNGLMKITKNNKVGYMNRKLELVVPFGTFDEAFAFNENGFAIVKKGDKYGIINSQFQLVLDVEYDEISDEGFYGNKIETFVVKKGNFFKIYNEAMYSLTGEQWLKSVEYFGINSTKPHNYKFKIEDFHGNVGIINSNCSYTISMQPQQILWAENDDLNIVKRDGKIWFIKPKFKQEIPSNYTDYIYHTDEGEIILKQAEKYGVIKEDLMILIPFVYQSIEKDFDKDDCFIAKKDNKFGKIDRFNKIVIPFEYDYISNWVEYGPKEHFVEKNGKQGLIARNGEIVVPIIYDELIYFNSDLIFAKKQKKWGTINSSNQTIIPFIYDEMGADWGMYYMERSKPLLIVVKKNGKRMLIDSKNTIIQSKLSQKEQSDYLYFSEQQKLIIEEPEPESSL